MPNISDTETSSSEEYTSEEESLTLEPNPQQMTEENQELHRENTDLEEGNLVADISQHFDQSLHLEDQPQSSPFDYHQPLPPLTMSNQPATAPRVSELRLGRPDNFDGSSNKATAWMDSVKIYLLINEALYDTDQKKIAFALFFMREGLAATWASTFTKKALALAIPDLGTWIAFEADFKTSFIHVNVKNEAIAWLTTTIVTKNLLLGDYISQFKNNVALSEITHEDTLINFFSRGIPIPLMKRIYSMDTVPTKIDDWYAKAIHFKTQWDRADAIASKKPYNPYPSQKNHAQQPPKIDPYTMEVNIVHIEKLTKEEREKCIKEGWCLWCRKPGHYSKDCYTFNKNNSYTKTPPKKPQEPRKIANIEEILEVQPGEEVSKEEELIAKLSTQDF